MGLHTGHPEPFEDNLVGLDVHVAARVAATAHGGQVVLSSTTAQRVTRALPPGASSSTWGCTDSRTSTEPQRLCQLVVPGMPAAFPPLRSLGAPGSLPSAPTRSSAARTSWRLSSRCCRPARQRLVTLTGPGGTGKTRLSLAVAEELAPAFPDGVHFVDLATATEHSMAWTTLAETLGRVRRAAGRPPRPPPRPQRCWSCSTTSSSCRAPVRPW